MAENPTAPLLGNQPTDQGYNAGNMYGQPAPQQATYQQPQYAQPQYTQPQYGQQPQYAQPPPDQGQPVQYVVQPLNPAQQNQGAAPALQQPTDQQLGEGVGELPVIVSQHEPTRVTGGKDGVGMSEGCMRNPHVLTWIFTLAIWYMLASIVVCVAIGSEGYCSFFAGNIGAALGITAAVAIAYWIECFCAGTGKYLRNILQKEGAAQFVERLKGQPAVIHWDVACYHWETRRRSKTVRDANGNTRTEWETYREKVYTWRATEQYRYTTCIDVSGQLLGLDEYNLTKLRLRKIYGFVDVQSQQHYAQQRRTFRMMNWRDMHQEFHERYDIPGFVDRILAESEPGIKPGWMSASCYWVCNLLFMSPCFRHKMSAACGNAEYTFIKQLSAY